MSEDLAEPVTLVAAEEVLGHGPLPIHRASIRHARHLVGGFNPSEKYEFVNWDDEIPNSTGKIKVMFQSTNQALGGT